MKYSTATAQVFILAGVANAFPHPQKLPEFQFPDGSSASTPTPTADISGDVGAGLKGDLEGGLSGGLGGGLGGGLSDLIPSGLPDLSSLPSDLPGLGSSGFSLSDLLGNLSGGLGGLFGGSSGKAAAAASSSSDAATKTTSVVIPVSTGEASGSTSISAKAAPSSGAGTIGKDCKPQTGGGMNENGIKDKNCCTDMTVIFARGTGEPGNAGIISGPPMFKALRQKLGADRVTVQGVDYPAAAAGNAASGGNGGKIMAELVSTALTQCPSTKIILSGYSQGGMVVHSAFRAGVTKEQVAGAVQFGDPYKRMSIGDLPKDKVKQFCGTMDQVCGGGGDGGATGSHLSYGSVADAAATFAIEAAGLA